MIDKSKLFSQLDEMKNKLNGKTLLVEIRLKTLLRKAPTKVKRRSKGYTVQYRIRLYKNGKNKFYFFVKKSGNKSKYRVNFEFKGNKKEPLKDDVKCSCTCGYWKYWGPDWNAKQNNYNLRKMSNGAAPDIRDPKRENYICKHVYAAGKILANYLTTESPKKKEKYGTVKDIDYFGGA